MDSAAWMDGKLKVFYDQQEEGAIDLRAALSASQFAALAGIGDKKACARLIRLTDSGESLADCKASKGQERRAAKERRSLNKDSGEGGSGNALQTGTALAEDGTLGVNGQDNDEPGGGGSSKKGKKAGTKGKEKADSWEADVIMPPACECGGALHATFECPLCGTCCDCDLWALSACGHHYCVQCLVRAIKVSVSDAKLFQCVTCVEEGTANGITETDVELLCQGQFREKALHEVLRDYVLKQAGGVVWGGCGEANLVSDVTEWDDLRCLACGGYMMEKRIVEEAADKAFDKWKGKHKHATCPACKAVVQKIDGCNHMSCRCGVGFCYRCSKVGI
jgi:hypothetical protein